MAVDASLSAFDRCLGCGLIFIGIEGKVPVRGEWDSGPRIGYVCPECATTKMVGVNP